MERQGPEIDTANARLMIISLDRMRTDRHEAIYGLESSVTEERAGNALKQAREFIEAVKNLLSSREGTKFCNNLTGFRHKEKSHEAHVPLQAQTVHLQNGRISKKDRSDTLRH